MTEKDGLPVSSEAIQAAAKAMWETGRKPNPLVRSWDRSENERGKDETRDIARETIQAFLTAEGFTADTTEAHEPYPSFEGYSGGEEGAAVYRARCHRCDWTGPLRVSPERNMNKDAARKDAEPHRAFQTRLVGPWRSPDAP